MTRNPLYNAILAAGYIVLVASFMFYGSHYAPGPDTVLMPIAMISLFTLSAAIMAFAFFYQPILLYLDGDKASAVRLIMNTIGIFALLTIVFFAAIFVLQGL